MVKFYSFSHTYDYSFPAVSLAYFLRYPNPYSTHVLSTDVISRNFDPSTQQLTTLRLHLKRSKLPSAVVKLLPRSLLGSSEKDDSQSFIIEKSIVDIKEGWMRTESQNLDWTGVLTVIESQDFKRREGTQGDMFKAGDPFNQSATQRTDVDTTVTLKSNIGETFRNKRARMSDSGSSGEQEAPAKVGFFRSWTTGSIQRSVELIGLRRAEGAQPKATEGMKVVLERMRQGGLVGVLEGMRKDRELMFTGQGTQGSQSDRKPEVSAVEIDYDN